MTTNYIEAPAAALGKDIPCDYLITVNGKTRRTTGTVIKVRRTGEFQIEITLKHRRTGEIHTNTMDARATVWVFAAFLQTDYTAQIDAGLPTTMAGMGEIWTEGLVDQLKTTLDGNMWTFAGMPITA